MTSKLTYTLDEFCAAIGIGRTNAYEQIAKGRLIAVKLGKRTMITAAEAERFVATLPSFKSAAPVCLRDAGPVLKVGS